jgi:hypothetical protein
MRTSPLFNPYSPAGMATTLDHFDLIEEQVDETEMPVEPPLDEVVDPPPLMKGD